MITGAVGDPYPRGLSAALNARGHEVVGTVVRKGWLLERSRLQMSRRGLSWRSWRASAVFLRQALASRFAGARPVTAPGDGPVAGPRLGAIFPTRDVNGPDVIGWLKALQPELVIYAGGWGILRADLIEVAAIGLLNAHMGPLPEYKGMNVLEWCLLQGDLPCVTVHFMDAGVDTGPVLAAAPIPLDGCDDIAAARWRGMECSIELIADAVDAVAGGTAQPVEQPGSGTTYFVMHKQLRAVAERRLQTRSAPAAPLCAK